jgi:hypothetical protein
MSAKSRPCLNLLDFQRLAMYRVHVCTGLLACITVCTDDETVFDSYNSIYAEVIDLIDLLLSHEASCRQTTGPKFSFDTFANVPLHMVGQTCRDPILRRAVVRILHQYPRREGYGTVN